MDNLEVAWQLDETRFSLVVVAGERLAGPCPWRKR
jgi:hypothetical protein